MSRVALVTGASRGLGEEVVRGLRARGLLVIGASRSSSEHPLDVRDPASIDALARAIDALDVLVNNAGIAQDGFDEEVARETIDTNLLGPVRLTEALLPKLRENASVVMVSSGMGEVSILAPKLRARVMDPSFDRDAILETAEQFVRAVATREHEKLGFPSSAYGVSKALLNAYARALARSLAGDPRRIKINAVCPGWVRTAMGGARAPRSVDEGARGILWAALLPPEGKTGGFFRDERAVPW